MRCYRPTAPKGPKSEILCKSLTYMGCCRRRGAIISPNFVMCPYIVIVKPTG